MKKKKKGFTLVELLVVIAILAILAAVSVVGYLSFTNKAKQSADEQAVTQMNIALEAQEAIDAPENVEEAKDVLEEAGFNIDDYVPLNKNNIFYYDESEIRVLIYDQIEQKVTFPENLEKKYSNFTEGNKPGTWYVLNDKTYEWVSIDEFEGASSVLKFINALQNATDYQIVKLTDDVNVPNMSSVNGQSIFPRPFPSNSNGTARVDLNNHTLKLNSTSHIGGLYENNETFEQNIYLSNGKIVANNVSWFEIHDESSLTLNNIEFTNTATIEAGKNYNIFSVNDYSNLTIIDSVVKAENGDTCSINLYGTQSETNIINSTLVSTSYGITTNADMEHSWNVRANVVNSTITTTKGASVLVNVPGVYNFEKCTIEGNGQGVVIRGGDATFENSTITISGDNTKWNLPSNNNEYEFSKIAGTADKTNDYTFPFVNQNGTWTSGNGVQFGSLIVGDWAGAYNYDASCSLVNTLVYMNDTWSTLPIVYLSQDNGNTTTLTYDASCKFYKNNVIEDNAIIINSMNESGVLPSGNIVVNK